MPNPLKLMMGTAGVAGGSELWTIGGANDHGALATASYTMAPLPAPSQYTIVFLPF